MMRKITLILFCASGILATNCTKDVGASQEPTTQSPKIMLSQDEFKSIAHDNPFYYEETEVLQNLAEFLDGLYKDKPESRSVIRKFKVVEKYYFSTDGDKAHKVLTRSSNETNAEPLIYEIDIDEGAINSCALVSADSRSPGVLYYGPKIEDIETENDIITANLMQGFSKAGILEDIRIIEKAQAELREQTLEKIAVELNIPQEEINYEAIKDRIQVIDGIGVAGTRYNNNAGGYQDGEIGNISATGPYLNTKWDGNAPYNHSMPMQTYPAGSTSPVDYQANALAGSAPIALGQIAAYYKPPMIQGTRLNGTKFTVDYNKINNESGMIFWMYDGLVASPADEIENISGLIRTISDECIPTYVTSGGKYSKTTHTKAGVEAFVKKYFKVFGSSGSTSFVNWNVVDANNSLVVQSPVIATGKVYTPSEASEDHFMLIDSYCSGEKLNRTTGKIERFNYWHVNMGYGAANYAKPAWFRTDPNSITANVDILFFVNGKQKHMKTSDLQMIWRICRMN